MKKVPQISWHCLFNPSGPIFIFLNMFENDSHIAEITVSKTRKSPKNCNHAQDRHNLTQSGRCFNNFMQRYTLTNLNLNSNDNLFLKIKTRYTVNGSTEVTPSTGWLWVWTCLPCFGCRFCIQYKLYLYRLLLSQL